MKTIKIDRTLAKKDIFEIYDDYFYNDSTYSIYSGSSSECVIRIENVFNNSTIFALIYKDNFIKVTSDNNQFKVVFIRNKNNILLYNERCFIGDYCLPYIDEYIKNKIADDKMLKFGKNFENPYTDLIENVFNTRKKDLYELVYNEIKNIIENDSDNNTSDYLNYDMQDYDLDYYNRLVDNSEEILKMFNKNKFVFKILPSEFRKYTINSNIWQKYYSKLGDFLDSCEYIKSHVLKSDTHHFNKNPVCETIHNFDSSENCYFDNIYNFLITHNTDFSKILNSAWSSWYKKFLKQLRNIGWLKDESYILSEEICRIKNMYDVDSFRVELLHNNGYCETKKVEDYRLSRVILKEINCHVDVVQIDIFAKNCLVYTYHVKNNITHI